MLVQTHQLRGGSIKPHEARAKTTTRAFGLAQMETLELFVSTTCPGLERTTTIGQEWHATKSLLILPTLCHCAIQPSWYVLLPNIFLVVLQTKSLKLTGSISQLVRALQLPVAPPRAPPPDLHIRLRAPDVPCPPRPEQDRVRLRCPITISHICLVANSRVPAVSWASSGSAHG